MNWGYRIAIGITCFVCFILFMVVKAFERDVELVSEDYYAQEIAYQNMINAKANALAFQDEFTVNYKEDGFVLGFESKQDLSKLKGNVLFYKPDNSKLDVSHPISFNTQNKQFFSYEKFKKGTYLIKMSFLIDNESYYIEKKIIL